MTGRTHGEPPYRTVVVHGGPGAPGSAFGLAVGVAPCLEPFQTRDTLQGQIEELANVVERDAEPPVVLVGHSWGAMLSLLVVCERPGLVRKAVLVGSGGFTADSYARTHEARMSRLSTESRRRAEDIRATRSATPDDPQAELMREYYDLISRADAYDPEPEAEDQCGAFENDVNKKVWAEVVTLRESGELLSRVARARCPVVAIHGDHDPHPADAVSEPLSGVLAEFRMFLLSQCGHEPWKERQARDAFFGLLRRECEA